VIQGMWDEVDETVAFVFQQLRESGVEDDQ
jgi:hypothetical protein